MIDDAMQMEQAETRTEQMLCASELSYRRLFETAQDGILILEADTGRISDVNPFLMEMLGFSRDEMVGKAIWEISPFKDIVSNKIKFAQLQQQGYVRYENLPLEARDGCRHAVEFVSNVYRAGDRNVIQCNIRDITERKRAEETLRHQAEELRARNEERERFNRATVGRELQIVRLKQQINELCRQMDKPLMHRLDFLDAESQTSTAAETVRLKGESGT